MVWVSHQLVWISEWVNTWMSTHKKHINNNNANRQFSQLSSSVILRWCFITGPTTACVTSSLTSAVTSSTQTSECDTSLTNTSGNMKMSSDFCLVVVFRIFSGCVCAGLVFSADGSAGFVRRVSHLHETHVRWETISIIVMDLTCKYEVCEDDDNVMLLERSETANEKI